MLGKMGMSGQESMKPKNTPTNMKPKKEEKRPLATPPQTIDQQLDALTDEQLEKIFKEEEKPAKTLRGKKNKK